MSVTLRTSTSSCFTLFGVLPSLEREARKTYHIDRKLIDKWLITPFGYDLQHYHEETDVSYLQHLWDYFDIDYLKWPTKNVYVLKKPN